MLKRIAIPAALVLLAACKTTSAFPPAKDIAEVTERKPAPKGEILTDADAGDLYDSDIEAWGERVRAAGMRLCRFYERTGMPDIACPKESSEQAKK
jgi:hypothetical protein